MNADAESFETRLDEKIKHVSLLMRNLSIAITADWSANKEFVAGNLNLNSTTNDDGIKANVNDDRS